MGIMMHLSQGLLTDWFGLGTNQQTLNVMNYIFIKMKAVPAEDYSLRSWYKHTQHEQACWKEQDRFWESNSGPTSQNLPCILWTWTTKLGLSMVRIVSQANPFRTTIIYYGEGTRWRSWFRHCATSWKVAGSIPDGVIGIFHWHNPSYRTIVLGLTQPLTEMSTRIISWEVKAAGA